MDLKLKGKKALITGGSKGIGRACAEVLASEGCGLYLAARGKEALLETKESLENLYGIAVKIHPLDLSIGAEAKSLAMSCLDIDILINNAGSIPAGSLWHIEESKWRDAWDLKVFGYINLCREVYPQMRSRGKGIIINIIGAAGERPNINYIAGGSANAALMAFTKALGGRSLRDNIRVVAVNPGLIHTERLEKLMRNASQSRFGDPKRWKELLPKTLPPGKPKDVANLVAFLASECAGHISGTVVTVDGGAVSA